MQTLEEIIQRISAIKARYKPEDSDAIEFYGTIEDIISRGITLGLEETNILIVINNILKSAEEILKEDEFLTNQTIDLSDIGVFGKSHKDPEKEEHDPPNLIGVLEEFHIAQRTMQLTEDLVDRDNPNSTKIKNYVFPIVLHTTERKRTKELGTYRYMPTRERIRARKLSDTRNLEDLMYDLDESRRGIISEFVEFMFKNNYQCPKSLIKDSIDPEYLCVDNSLRHGFNVALSALEVLTILLHNQKTRISDRTKQIIFKNLIGYNFKTGHMKLVDKYAILLDKEYDDWETATECLSIAFQNLSRICDPHSFSDVIPAIENGVKTLEEIANLLKTKPRSPVFYDLVKTFVTNSRFDPILNNLETFERLRETEGLMEGCVDFFDRYFYAIRSDERFLVPNALEVLTYNEVRDVEELRLCSETSVGDYTPVKVVGRGGSSIVFKAVDINDDLPFALKKYKRRVDPGDSNLERFVARSGGMQGVARRERIAAMQLTHDNIVRYFGRTTDSEGNEVIIHEFVDGFSLEDYVRDNGPLDVINFYSIFNDLIKAIAYMQKKRCVHRDIKPSNIIITRNFGTAKITDLQTAIFIDWENLYSMEGHQILVPNELDGQFTIGARSWTAPELLRDGRVSFQSDMYSLGLCMYYALFGEHPTPDMNPEKAKDQEYLRSTFEKLESKLDTKLDAVIGQIVIEGARLTRWFINLDYKNRPSVNEFLELNESLHRRGFFIQ